MSGIRAGGWNYPIIQSDWTGLLERFLEARPRIVHVTITPIIESILRSSVAGELVYATSMWDLLVCPRPGAPAPVDAVRVSSAPSGNVVIEHLPLVGIADRIERPVAESVPLFWRFMKEKYGIDGREQSSDTGAGGA